MKIRVFFAALSVVALSIAACSSTHKPGPSSTGPGSSSSGTSPDSAQPAPEDPLPARTPAEQRVEGLVIIGGVHGNEPSGAKLLPTLIEQGYVVFGPANPWGLENNSRYLEDGRDLNRSFSLEDCPEAVAVREFLEKNPPKLLIDMHEAPSGTHPYLIQFGPDDDLGARIIEELKGEYDFDPKPSWGPIEGADGLLKPTKGALALQALSGIWSLGFYAWRTYDVTAFTVEVPGSWEMERKKAYHLKVVKTAERLFAEGLAE